jgi:hypothetical protein
MHACSRKAIINEFRGRWYVDVREYYQKEGEWLPGPRGIALTAEQWKTLSGALPDLERAMESLKKTRSS